MQVTAYGSLCRTRHFNVTIFFEQRHSASELRNEKYRPFIDPICRFMLIDLHLRALRGLRGENCTFSKQINITYRRSKMTLLKMESGIFNRRYIKPLLIATLICICILPNNALCFSHKRYCRSAF